MNALEAGLYTQLVTTATALYTLVSTKVYFDQAPAGIAKPYVVFQLQAGGDINETPIDRSELVYLVKGISTAPLEAGQIDDAIRTRLHNQTITVSGYTAIGVKREGAIRYSEQVNAVTIWHCGALYRIYLSN